MPWKPPPPTLRGYEFAEVASALQKSIRRGLEEESLFWAAELDRSGYGRYLWYRLRIIACEDVGLAEGPDCFAEIQALHDAWKEIVQKKHGHKPERLMIGQAVLRLVRARKSEMVGEAVVAHWSTDERLYEIPDYALDPHTARGRAMGRRVPDFWDVTYYLENRGDVEGDERYRDRAIASESSRFHPSERETMTEKESSEALDVPMLDPRVFDF